MTWDGQPAGEMAAAIDAVIAAAWCAGRDAAAKVADHMTMLDGDCDQLGPTDWETGVRECALELRDEVCPCGERAGAAELVRDAIRALTPPPDLLATLRPGGPSSHPERIAAAAIESAAEREIGQPRGALAGVGKIAVEAISAVELVIVPAERMTQLLELERAMRGPVAAIAAERQRQIETERSENPTRRQAGAHIPAEADVMHDYNSPLADALAQVAAERRRQVEKGRGPEHDDRHDLGELARAAICYAAADSEKLDCIAWLAPWGADTFTTGDRRADLIRAASLLVAEIERIDRATAAQEPAP